METYESSGSPLNMHAIDELYIGCTLNYRTPKSVANEPAPSLCAAVLEAAAHAAVATEAHEKKTEKWMDRNAESKIGLSGLDQSKAAVIGSLRPPESQRGYRHAIE